jgi:ferrous iron transport protein B
MSLVLGSRSLREPPAVAPSPTLADLQPGQSGCIASLAGRPAIRRRLAEMGLVPGVEVTVERRAPLGDPIEVAVRGYRLSLRGDQARGIVLGRVPTAAVQATPVEPGPVAAPVAGRAPVIALAGNPNAGKTTLFNAITGLRQHVATYPGVTVERKEGRAPLSGGRQARIIDLPGIYSLIPASPDERIATEVLAGLREDTPAPDLVLAVVDATNLARNLLLATQLLDTGLPVVVALTMVDEARTRGIPVDAVGLERSLGVPVVPVVAATGEGLVRLRQVLDAARSAATAPWRGPVLDDHDRLAEAVIVQARTHGRELTTAQGRLIAWGLLGEGDFTGVLGLGAIEPLTVAVARIRAGWAARAIDPVLDDITRRYAWIDALVAGAVAPPRRLVRDRIDGLLLHRVAGPAVFALVMWGLFVAIFTLAAPLMDAAEGAVLAFGAWVAPLLGEGLLHDLWLDGIIAGVGGVMIFAPQIAMMFILLAILDESGYLARGAFLLDRLLGAVGLHGRSFVPLLSSHACAIPGIMAARTIPDARERLATMLVAPFMSCSARLPVYGLLIGMFFGQYAAWQQGTIMAGLYLGGIVAAALAAWLLRRTALRGASSSFLIELPPYRLPSLGEIVRVTWRGLRAFLVRAGTIILVLSVLLWAAMTFPGLPEARQAELAAAHGTTLAAVTEAAEGDAAAADAGNAIRQAALRHSLAGRAGGLIEPLIAPLGMDWQTGVGLIGAFAAREVFVSTMGVVHGVGSVGDQTTPLEDRMRAATRPDGTPVWTPLLAVVVLVWFVLAMQCLSTVAVMVRETGGWRWPLLQLAGMNTLAWLSGLAIWQIGSRL